MTRQEIEIDIKHVTKIDFTEFGNIIASYKPVSLESNVKETTADTVEKREGKKQRQLPLFD